jgi:glutamate N-acetyltransferase/amino-acid N-acetyltransferase
VKRSVQETPLAVPGFRFGAAACGIKRTGAPDCAVLVADRPSAAAAAFTTNRFCAAPVAVGRERARSGRLQALVVNSGNANACTGARGLADARRMTDLAGRALGIPSQLVAPASTGVIGVRLPMAALATGIAAAAASASPDRLWDFSRAIMTSDAYPKVVHESVRLGGERVSVVGIAKGAGMIAPNMATLLVFVLTDAEVAPAVARRAVAESCDGALNGLTVDGDTSTNDSLFLLASGAAGNRRVSGGADAARLASAARAVCLEIAKLVAADGEGATKLVTIEVGGARSVGDARRVGRAVANSLLVKTAFFGNDPNWGRIACAIGYSGVPVDPERVTIQIGPVAVFRRGAGQAAARERARREMEKQEVKLRISLGLGAHAATVVTSDLSHDYVEFNSAYTT